jgi:hypothetical protein
MIARVCLAVVLCALGFVPAWAQQPAASADKNTGVIRGRVVTLDTGRPLRRAQVSLASSELRERKITGTNLRGEFELTGLPAGRYTVNVTRSGYLRTQYGQRRPGGQGKALELAAGQTLDKLEIPLQRAAIISGRVADENGEPVSGVNVYAMRPQFYQGRREMARVASARTDDTGQYRILGLAPGTYTVLARIRETWMIPGPPKRMLGYSPTFFPSTARAADALRVTLAPGEEAQSTDITLVFAPSASISGMATRSDGTPLAGGRVGLSENYRGPFGSSFMGITDAIIAADGSWHMRGIAPGDYELSVSDERRDGRSESARQSISLQGADIEGVLLTTNGDGILTGEVTTDDGQPVPSATPTGAKLRVAPEAIGPGALPTQIAVGDDNGNVGADGRFTFRAPSGRAVVRVWGLPRGWAVKETVSTDRENGSREVTINPGQTHVVKVVLTSKFPTVSGTVLDDRGAPADAAILMFPADESRWLGTIDDIHTGSVDKAGAFRFDTVRPGDYIALALEDFELSDAADPAFLRELLDKGQRITVREGEPLQLNLKIGK